MRKGTIIQIKGLGIPVQSPTDRNLEGYEVRWSSDPEVAVDAPAHVLIGHEALTRFIELAVDRRFLVADLMTVTPVTVPDNSNSLSRSLSEAAGINPDNWNTVRMAMVISGNGPRGAVMDEIEWVGSRDEFNEGAPLAEAYAHAKHRQIKMPSIHKHTESGHIMRAAHFFGEFRRQLKPSLRAAEMMARVLEQNLCSLDLTAINGDKATHYLMEIQRAFIQRREHAQIELAENGMVEWPVMVEAFNEAHDTPTPSRPSRGPSFH